jgi:hypothetical protein
VNARVEILVDATSGVPIESGQHWEGLRVRYRQEGVRRWEKFIAVGAPGQSLRDLLFASIFVVSRANQPGGGLPATLTIDTQEQLDLGATA